jgi:polysaccharide transporter, PST family
LKEYLKNNLDQGILKNLVWLLGDKLFRMGGGLLIGILVAKYLGPEEFGLFNFVFSFVWLFSHFVTLGLDEIVTRDLISYPNKANTLLGTAFGLKSVAGIATFFFIALLMFFLKNGSKEILTLTIIMSISMILKNVGVFRLLFESQLQSKQNVIAENFGFVAVSILRVVFIYFTLPLIYFAWALVFEVFVSSLVFVFLYNKKNYKLLDWNFNRLQAKTLLKESWPLILSGLSIMIYVKSDQVMLGLLSTNLETGIYSVAARLSEIWYFIPVAIVTSYFPSLVESKKISETEYKDKFSKLLRILLYSSTAIAIVMMFLSDFVVQLLFGKEYTESGVVLSIHIWAGIFAFLGVGSSKFFIIENLQKYYLYQTITGATLNVILNLFLIPRYGANGAAIATVISYGFSICSFMFFYDLKLLKEIMKNILITKE